MCFLKLSINNYESVGLLYNLYIRNYMYEFRISFRCIKYFPTNIIFTQITENGSEFSGS